MPKSILLASSVLLLSTGGNAATISYPGNGGTLPDEVDFTSAIDVADSFNITDVNVTLSGLQHSFLADLRVTLSNGARTIFLLRENGNRLKPNGDFVFDDSASLPVSQLTAFGGTFQPLQPLSTFNGQPTVGTWTLRIRDVAPLDFGQFAGWKLSFQTDSAVVPEPAAWALMLVGFGATGYRIRRRTAQRYEVLCSA